MAHKYDPNCKCETCTVKRMAEDSKCSGGTCSVNRSKPQPIKMNDTRPLDEMLTSRPETMKAYMTRKNRAEGKIR